MNARDISPSTPVLVGVGQFAESLDDPNYEGLSATGLAARAAQAALDDAGTSDTAALAAAVHTVAGVRQFEISQPGSQAPLGRSNNMPRSVAARVGASPVRAILEVAGGQGPQHLVNEFAREIDAGKTDVVLIFGSEAISTTRHFAGQEERPDFNERIEGSLEDRGYGLRGLTSLQLSSHGLIDAPSQYALAENARRARLDESREAYALSMGAVFAPFTEVAAANPYAAAPTVRSATELSTVTERNRYIAEPFTRFVVARDQVNQGAAVVLMSVEAARRLGVPEERWVFIHGHADLRERDILDRQDLGCAPSAVMASKHALEVAGIGIDDVSTFDLYSCFPIAVTNVLDGLGLEPDDPRGLTLTGGLPFFGGAGNNYSMHAIAETVYRCRQKPGSYGLVGANGGTLSKYSVGVYSTTPSGYRLDRSKELQAEIDALPCVPVVDHPEGPATIETFTVKHAKSGRLSGIVIGRLDATGERFIAMGLEDDVDLLDLLTTAAQPVGEKVYVRGFGQGNRVTTSRERMDSLRPRRTPAFRTDYEFIRLNRDGHLLEITIDRPEARNALHPPAHEELDEIFDAYFADPELWVAIITGAGADAFSSGNDLVYSVSGKPMYIPRNGFAGLTSRAHLPKPIIAAVNGFAMGGGLETALACHLIVVDQKAQLALSEVRVGLVAGAGGVVRLPRQLPQKVATEMVLTGRRMGADEAFKRGLVNRISPDGMALDGARALASEILAGSPTSVRISLQLMEETAGVTDTVEAVGRRSGALDDLMTSEDMFEGLTAFAQKRPPEWKNR